MAAFKAEINKKEEWDAKEWNEDGSKPAEVDAEAINTWLFNTDTVDKVLETLMVKGQKVAGGDRLGKTIIFAKNNDHADFIAERFDANYPHYKGHFARVVTYKTEYAQNLIDDFSSKEKAPHIAISVDMLDTGIDVPEVVNLVFFKVVRSKTKFWQMVGRGTRLCKDLFGPGDDKKNFFIFDFCQNLEFFSQNPDVSDGASAEPLGTRLFKARLDLILSIDKGDSSPEERALRNDAASLLHQIVAAMKVDNFVVRPRRKYVEKFAGANAWEALSAEDHYELRANVAGLPSELTDEDEDAKRFDLLVLRAQLAILQAKPDWASLKEKIQAIAGALGKQANIPAIKAELAFIEDICGDDWWADVTVSMLETARRKLRALIKLIEKGKRHIVYTHFEDEIGEGVKVDLPQVTAGMNMAKFKEKVRVFLRAHESHLSLQRLRRNQPLTPTDLEELENMLRQAGGSQELISEAREKSQGLGVFIRSLVGPDREAAMQAFSEFVTGTTVTSNQIAFINLVVDELTQNGLMEPDRLWEQPYTNLSAEGPIGIFPQAKVLQIVEVLKTIRERAAA